MKLTLPIGLVWLLSCSSPNQIIQVDLSNVLVNHRSYIAIKTDKELNIDGKADESVWQATQWSQKFIDIEGEKVPKFDTRMKMVWDDDFLYVFAELKEPHIWGYLVQRDTVIFYNNDFEVFVSPSGTVMNYGEIEINALGTVWDLMLDKPYRSGGKANNHWNLDKLKSAVRIEGTVNDPSDTDSLWTVEMAIPMPALLELKDHPKSLPVEGEQWRINFSRVEWDYDLRNGKYYRKKDEDGKFLPEYNWVWSNQNVINMHEPEKWGFIQFTEKENLEDVEFIQDQYLETKQLLFALFRQTNFGKLKYLLEEQPGTRKTIEVKHGEHLASATFHKTHLGFEFIMTSPATGQSIVINEEGILKNLK